MISQVTIPDPETRARNVANWKEAILRLDVLNLELDRLIAMVEAENRKSPVTLHHLCKHLNPNIAKSLQEAD